MPALLLPIMLTLSLPEGVSAQGDAVDERPSYRGMGLREALLDLEARGVPLVFSSAVVEDAMTIAEDPTSSEPEALLLELLLPFGLAVERIGSRWVVIAASSTELAELRGAVRSRHSGEPLAGVELTIEELGRSTVSSANGIFRFERLPAGAYSLTASLRGHRPEERRTTVAAGGGAVDLTLQPLPLVEDEIVVRSSELTWLQESPASPISFDRHQIEALPHLGSDVFRAVSLTPGAVANDLSARFSVHGGRQDEVLINLDGQELYSAFHLQDFESALSVVPSEDLAGANLSTGSFTARSGDRMSAVLELRTRLPPTVMRTSLGLSLLNARASNSGTFDEQRGGWLVSARRGSIDLANRLLGNEDPSFWDLFGRLEHQLGQRHLLRGNLLAAGDRLDFADSDGEDFKSSDTRYDSRYQWITHQAVVGERLLVTTAASWSRIERDRRGVEDEEEQSFEVIDERNNDVGRLESTWSFLPANGRYDLEWGVHGRHYDASYDYSNEFEPALSLMVPGAETAESTTEFVDTFRGEHWAAWITDRFSPLARLTVELGARYDRHDLTDDTLWSPRVNLALRLGSQSVVRAGWGHFYQSQRPYELQVEDGETSFFTAERSEHWTLGYERLFGAAERRPLSAMRIEAYSRDIADPRPRFENLFEPVNMFPEVELDRVRIAPDSARSEGIETVLRGSAGSRFDWWLSYSWSQVEDRIDGADYRRGIDQPHSLRTVVDYRFAGPWSLSLSWQYHTGWPTTPVRLVELEDEDGEPEPGLELGPLNSDRLDDYHRLDLRLSRAWLTRGGEILFFVDLQNVYDHENLAGFDFSFDDEEGVLQVDREDWPGIFPSVGVRWEF